MKLKLVPKNDPESLLSAIGKNLAPSGIREFFDLVYTTPDCVSLGVGEPDFVTPWSISEAGMHSISEGYTHYTSNKGLLELRELISAHVEENYHITYDPDSEILVTLGVSQGLDCALRSIVNPGDEVIVFEPCYVSYTANIALLHGKPVMIPTKTAGGFSIDLKLLEKSITPKTKAILLNYPSNPTGATIDPATLKKIADISKRNNLIVLSDEIYAAIIYETEHVSIASFPGMKERTIFLNGFSKSHAMTGWRLGFTAAPKYLLDTMLKIHQYTALSAPSMAQYAAIEGLRRGGKDIIRMNREYLRRRNYIVNSFNDMGLPCPSPQGAFYVFPDISSTGLTSRDFALKLLEDQKVAVVPGNVFGPSGEGHIRCSYATSFELIREAMKRIRRFLEKRALS
jgi:aminotransferase